MSSAKKMSHIKTFQIFLLKFLKKTALLFVFFINISLEASTFEPFFTQFVSEIIAREYLKKNIKAFNNFIENHSFEDLISSAEQSNQQSQEILFSLYYFIKSRSIEMFKLKDNKYVALTEEDLNRIKSLIEKTNTPEAYFAWGFYLARSGDYKTGMIYLKKAKEAGHALAHLSIPSFLITENKNPFIPTDEKTNQRDIDVVYNTLKEMENKKITITGFDFLMGTILFTKDQYTDAKKYFEKETTKKHPYRTIISYGYLGMIYQKEGNNMLAKEQFTKALNRGDYGAKLYLLDIHIQEGNYKSASELLEDIATHWGLYNDVTAIKASVLLSYILSKGLGMPQDLIQSYVWIIRAQKIYGSSIDPNILKMVDPNTGRITLFSNFQQDEVNNLQTIKSEKKYKTQKQEIEDPFNLFSLIDVQNNISDMTHKQLKTIRQQLDILTQKLTALGELQKVHTTANTIFDNLHLPGGGSCEGTFYQ